MLGGKVIACASPSKISFGGIRTCALPAANVQCFHEMAVVLLPMPGFKLVLQTKQPGYVDPGK